MIIKEQSPEWLERNDPINGEDRNTYRPRFYGASATVKRIVVTDNNGKKLDDCLLVVHKNSGQLSVRHLSEDNDE